MRVKAPSYHILVRLEKIRTPKEEYSKGGIYIESVSDKELKKEQEAIRLGTVLYIGPTAFHTKYSQVPWCKIGDVVQFHKYSGDLIVRDDDSDGFMYRVIPDLDLKVVRTDDEDGVEI